MVHLTLLVLVLASLFIDVTLEDCRSPTKQATLIAALPGANLLTEHVINSGRQIKGARLTTLSSLLQEANTPQLAHSEKQAIIRAARTVISSLSVNRFLQLNFYNVDINAELVSLSKQIESHHNSAQSNNDFHSTMVAIFAGLRDRHTTYMVPEPLRSAIATLDFSVKTFFTADARQKGIFRTRYIATDVAPLLSHQNNDFVDGVELVSWNRVSISRFVDSLGRESYGSNEAAQLSNALISLTFRGLGIDPAPLEPFATIGFKDKSGREQVVQAPWLFFDLRGMGLGGHVERRSYLSSLLSSRRSVDTFVRTRHPRHTRKAIAVNKVAAELFEAEIIFTQLGAVGRLILPSFDANTTTGLTAEMSRILRLMPQKGLILDIRDNFGGQVDFAKSWIELLTNANITTQPQTVRASRLMARLTKQKVGESCSLKRFLGAFGPAVRTARLVGEPFSGPVDGLFLTGDSPKRLKQVYHGPLITIMNGLTYSAGDVFAALQVENGLSFLVGTSDRTGAGGASTVRYSELVDTFPRLFKALPGGTDFTCSYTRYFRSGSKQGALMEFFGVEPDERYYTTLNDLLFDEEDFVDYLVKKLNDLM